MVAPVLLAPHLPALAGCAAAALACLRLWQVLPQTRSAQPRRLVWSEESGTAMLDFVLTFPFFVMILLIVIQFALMVNARIIVSWAAFAAARSAVVWTDDGLGVAKKRAQRAAAVACTAISPVPALSIPFTDVGAELLVIHGTTNLLHRMSRVSGMHRYALAATEVEVTAGAEKGEIGPHDPVTVAVTYQLHLAVPYADGIFSRAFGGWRFAGPVMPIRETYTLTNEGKVHTEGGDPAECHYFNLSVTDILGILRRLF